MLFFATGLDILLPALAVFGFWIVLPVWLIPLIRLRLLPQWDDVKAELEPMGFLPRNYWRGNWWREEKYRKKDKKSKPEKK